MSHNITHKAPNKKPCGCNTGNIQPSKLDQAISQYETMTKEAEAARDRFIDATMSLPRIELEECTEAEVYAMFEDENTNS